MEVIRFDNEPAKTPTALHWDWFLIEEGSSNIILQGVGVITEQELDLIRSN